MWLGERACAGREGEGGGRLRTAHAPREGCAASRGCSYSGRSPAAGPSLPGSGGDPHMAAGAPLPRLRPPGPRAARGLGPARTELGGATERGKKRRRRRKSQRPQVNVGFFFFLSRFQGGSGASPLHALRCRTAGRTHTRLGLVILRPPGAGGRGLMPVNPVQPGGQRQLFGPGAGPGLCEPSRAEPGAGSRRPARQVRPTRRRR